ncbi:MAG: hypothetical protein A2107_06540 [Verrucomicrobia bacterium GWF2_62_7]|nr:MAG: hypothetical protein A2107_06540 [Verrucomicrobia bacterium GWF2_62_7]
MALTPNSAAACFACQLRGFAVRQTLMNSRRGRSCILVDSFLFLFLMAMVLLPREHNKSPKPNPLLLHATRAGMGGAVGGDEPELFL